MDTEAEKWRELIEELTGAFQAEFGDLTVTCAPEDVIAKIESIRSKKYRLETMKQKMKEEIKEKDQEISNLKSYSSDVAVSTYSSDSDTSSVAGECDRLQRELHKKEDELKSYKKEIEEIKKKFDQTTESFTLCQRRFDEVASQRDDVKSNLEKANQAIYARDEHIRHLNEVQEELRQEIGNQEETSLPPWSEKIFQGTTQVILKKQQGKFGVSFGRNKNEMPYITESRITVHSVDAKLVDTNQVKEGDFVMEINGHNTQLASMDDVRYYCGNNNTQLKMRIKRAHPQGNTINIKGNKDNFADYSLRIGLFFTDVKPNSYGARIGICNNDEIVSINDKEPDKFSPNDIKRKLTHEVRLKLRRNIVPDIKSVIDETADQCSVYSDSSIPASKVSSQESPNFENSQSSSPPTQSYPMYDDQLSGHLTSVSMVDSPPDNLSQVDHSSSDVILRQNHARSISDIVEQPQIFNQSRLKKRITINKKSYESLGWQLTGGNKIGIFVKAVDNWTPVQTSGMKVGWKIQQIQSFDIVDVAYCYVIELLDHLKDEEKIRVVCDCISQEEYEKTIENLPHDSFHIRARRDYKDEQKKLIFLKEDILRVIDTTDRTKWKAYLPNGSLVLIPAQPSVFSKKKEPEYQVIPEPKPEKKLKGLFQHKKSDTSDPLYEFCDNVEIIVDTQV